MIKPQTRYFVRCNYNNWAVFHEFCNRNRIEKIHISNGWIKGHAGTALYSAEMNKDDITALKLLTDVTITERYYGQSTN